ncbi:MFS transporter [Candidatus Endobugula sertula]|uniref:MFS transporter n=1 Tax=Candidatus Endobugula sertula TaxID=62101 RepID=A0A1D2QRA2_9GAMM|nr:MFS transporter [Candidatus Endobugula sertula]
MTQEITQEKPVKKENIWMNIIINIVAPTVILSKFSGGDALGVELAIIIALAFPLLYGLREMMQTGKFNLFSAVGIFSVMVTGGMALLKFPPEYIAIKEAGIPALFAIFTLISLKTRFPLVKTFLYNDKIMQIEKVDRALEQLGTKDAFERSLKNASYLIALSFLVSSVLNYILAVVILVSEPGTEAFNAELGKMTALSFPVIAVPATIVMMFALFYLFRQITRLTQLKLEEILNAH